MEAAKTSFTGDQNAAGLSKHAGRAEHRLDEAVLECVARWAECLQGERGRRLSSPALSGPRSDSFLHPQIPVEATVADGFGEVDFADVFVAVDVRDGAGHS